MIILFDIDGTIADNSHRSHFVEDQSCRKDTHVSDWDSFLHPDNVAKDRPITHMIELGRKFYDSLFTIHILTGRQESLRDTTVLWLNRHGFSFYTELHMRSNNDYRPDYEVKREIINKYYKPGQIHLAIDDRKPVVDVFNFLGIPTLHV